MPRFLLSGLVLLACPLASVAGQIPNLQPGQRVRVTAPSYDLRRTPATFHAIRADTLHFSVTRGRSERSSGLEDSLVLAVPVDLVLLLEEPAGRRRNWDKGARTGAIVGGGLGLLVGVGIATCDDPWFCSQTGGQSVTAVLGGTAVGGFAGSLFGAAIGALSSRDVWRDVPLGRVRVAVYPTPNGVGLGLSIRF